MFMHVNFAKPCKLAAITLSRYSEDLLFYLYYNFGGDSIQLAAAMEL